MNKVGKVGNITRYGRDFNRMGMANRDDVFLRVENVRDVKRESGPIN